MSFCYRKLQPNTNTGQPLTSTFPTPPQYDKNPQIRQKNDGKFQNFNIIRANLG